MSAEELVSEEPRTRACRTCGVEINAASARCPYCGTRQFKRQPILGIWGALVCLIAVGAAVLITRTLTQTTQKTVSYSYYRSSDLVALVPAGYKDLYLAAPHGTALAGWRDPVHTGDSETVKATRPVHGTPSSRLRALAAHLRQIPGIALGYRGPVTFPGGQPASELEYTHGRFHYEAIVTFDACYHTIAVTVTITADRYGLLNDLSLVLPQSASAICDGPDFSSRDRANPSVPLAPAH